MACEGYNCARASGQTYQVGYMTNAYAAGVVGANVPYQTSSTVSYKAAPGSLGMPCSYS